MRLFTRTLSMAWLGVAAVLAGGASAAEPIATRQNTFSVPFRIRTDAGAAQPEQPAEIELYISADQGTSWQLHSRVPPHRRSFKFQAQRDGEYWFSIRTRDRAGRVLPVAPLSAELRVLVDTTPPALELTARRGPSGEIITAVRIHEPYLKSDSLKLEFLAIGSSEPWQPVATRPLPPAGQGPLHQDELSWLPAQPSEAFAIRAEITDLAGNPAVTQIQVAAAANDTLNLTPAQTASAQPPLATALSATNVSTATAWPADETRPLPLTSVQPPSPTSALVNPDASDWRPRDQQYSSAAAPLVAQVVPLPAQPIQPAVGSSYGVPANAGGNGSDAFPPGVQPRMVSAPRFNLEYDVDSVGPWGIRKVELWGTADGGRTWGIYGSDDDNRSPLLATVSGEGLYGFRILVHSGSGLVELPPQAGDNPEIWVAVDLTRPVCRIARVEHGAGERSGQLIVEWEAEDRLLAQRPVSLYFSGQPGGPWYTIAADLRNSGRYVWQVDNRVPEEIYLRLEVRDEAGNMSFADTTEGVRVDGLRPRGRIRDVRPLNEAATRPKVYRFN